MAQEAYHTIVTQLPHKLRVMRMYRYGLRELLNWSSTRFEWYPRAQALRLEFESNKHLTDREEIRKQVELGEELLSRFKHWDPLTRPELPGGTGYGSNPQQHKFPKGMVLNLDYLDDQKKGDWM